jgi:hypothetical protein
MMVLIKLILFKNELPSQRTSLIEIFMTFHLVKRNQKTGGSEKGCPE